MPQYANSRLFPAIASFVSLQLELHLLMVHLLMVHLPMVDGAPSCSASSCYAPYWAATCTVHRYANSRLSPAIDYAPLQISWWIQARARGEQVVRRRTHGGTLAWVISIPSLEQEVGTITTGSLMVLDTIITAFHFWDNHELPNLGQPC